MYIGHDSECPKCLSQKVLTKMTKKILNFKSIMVNGCVSLFALSKNHVLHKG
jgi:hypothetical protein